MKKIGEHVARGNLRAEEGTQLVDGDEVRIRLFDGRFDTAYRVTKFRVFGGDQTAPDISGRLSTEPNLDSSIDFFFDAGDNRQIGWAGHNGATDLNLQDVNGLIDRENLVIEDLYVTFRFVSSSTTAANYYIEMDKYDISETMGAVTMVANRSQGSDASQRWIA
jgi:hypothetical protein